MDKKKTNKETKGINFEVKYFYKDESGSINEDMQTIFAKDEKEAVEEVVMYLESMGVRKADIQTIQCEQIPDEQKKKCFEITFTWEDDKGNVSKLNEKVYAVNAEEAKIMIVKHTEERNKNMKELIFEKVDEIINGKNKTIEKLDEVVKPEKHETIEPAKKEKIPGFIRQTKFSAFIGKKTITEKATKEQVVRCLKFEIEVFGERADTVMNSILKFHPGESIVVELTPYQLVINKDTQPQQQTNMVDDEEQQETKAS